MEEDGTEPRPGITVGQESSMTKTGEDGGGWHRTTTWHHSWTIELYDKDRRRWRRMAQNPDLASQLDKRVGQESFMTKTGEDGGGWHRTPTWHHSWTKEFYDKEGRRWRRMAQNPDLASQLDKRVL